MCMEFYIQTTSDTIELGKVPNHLLTTYDWEKSTYVREHYPNSQKCLYYTLASEVGAKFR